MVLRDAHNRQLLTIGNILFILKINHFRYQARRLAERFQLNLDEINPQGFLDQTEPDLTSPISLRDAAILLEFLDYYALSIEMGLTGQALQTIREAPHDLKKHEMLWQLDNAGLLNYQRLLPAVNKISGTTLAESISETVNLEIPARAPDFQVYPNDRARALNQPLSLRDLAYFMTNAFVSLPALVQALDATELIREAITAKDYLEQSYLLILEKTLTLKGEISANQLITALYYPEINRWNLAHHIADALTGAESARQQLLGSETIMIGEHLNNTAEFTKALGIPNRALVESQETDDTFLITLAAFRLRRLTVENLAYALISSDNSKAIPLLPFLEGVSPSPLPPEDPAYLEQQQASETGTAPVSLPLTVENSGAIPLSHNWFWTGLALGIPYYQLRLMTRDTRYATNNKKNMYSLLLALQETETYETGHLYQALTFLKDDTSLEFVPASFQTAPSVPLSIAAPLSELYQNQIQLADLISDNPAAFGNILDLSQGSINNLTWNFSSDSRRVIIEMLRTFTDQYSIMTPYDADIFTNRLVKNLPSLDVFITNQNLWNIRQPDDYFNGSTPTEKARSRFIELFRTVLQQSLSQKY